MAQRHIAQALGTRRPILRAVATVVAIILAYVLASLPVLGIAVTRESIRNRGLDATNFNPEALGLDTASFLALILLPFAAGLLALWICMRSLYSSRLRVLVQSPRVGRLRTHRFFAALGLWAALLFVGETVGYLMHRDHYSLNADLSTWGPVALVVCLLIPLQIAFEEIAIRGYLLQQVYAAVRHPLIAVVSTSVLFGVLHFSNPEVAAFGLGRMATYYIGVGLFLGVLTVLDDGLELALGVHLATNLFVTLAVSYRGAALPTSSVISTSDVDIPLMLALFVVQAVIFFAAFAKTSPRWRWSSLTRRNPSYHNPQDV